jgi:hypothetical protein
VAEAAIVEGRFPEGPAPVPTADQLARAWALAVAGTGFVPMSRRATVAFLRTLAADLLAAFTDETFDRAVPLHVGAALVDAHFLNTAAIERTLALLGRELAARTPAVAERLALRARRRHDRIRPGPAGRTRRERDTGAPPPSRRGLPAEQARWDSEARFRTRLRHRRCTTRSPACRTARCSSSGSTPRCSSGRGRVCYLDLDRFTG